jgi:putative ABC transport system permease protein
MRRVFAPSARRLSGVAASSLSRSRRGFAATSALLALCIGFAATTAVFTSTYRHQVGVDAILTNGSDVTVTESAPPSSGDAEAQRLGRVAGVKRVEPVMHRFAYVGADLQDLYGVDPATIVRGAALQDAYVSGGTASGLMSELAREPDGVLVSAETVLDFQLHPGDLLRLRLPGSETKRPVTVPFHYLGIVKEFPTAPSDSFLVANRGYVARQTRDPSVDTYLLDARGSPKALAQKVRATLGPTAAHVTDVETSRRVVGSSLTAVDLSGLARLELVFACLLAVATAAVAFGLELAAKRRSYAILWAVGARSKQIGGFIGAEAIGITIDGVIVGLVVGAIQSTTLVKVLTGVFDPPPSHLIVPSASIGVVVIAVVVATATASLIARVVLSRPSVGALRDL